MTNESTTGHPTADPAAQEISPHQRVTPTNPVQDAGADAGAGAPASGTSKKLANPPLFGTILWGVLLIAFAGFAVVWSVLDIATDPTIWIIIGLLGAGLLLIVAGVAASLRRSS